MNIKFRFNIKYRLLFTSTLSVLFSQTNASAQNVSQENLDYTRIIYRDATSLANQYTHENINTADGSISIAQTDLTIPSNGGLDIEITRRINLTLGASGPATGRETGFGRTWWSLNIPRITTLTQKKWITRHPTLPNSRCSVDSPEFTFPPTHSAGAPGTFGYVFFHAKMYWSPPTLETPEDSNVLLIPIPSSPTPQIGPSVKWITKGLSTITCLPFIINGEGEGYTATTPNGNTYTFNWLASEEGFPLVNPPIGGFPTFRHSLYATKVEDIFGNWIEYDYEEPKERMYGVKLVAIRASDGRRADITYNEQELIQTITSGTRTVKYEYDSSTMPDGSSVYDLRRVIHPDGSILSIETDALNMHPASGKSIKCANTAFYDFPGETYFQLTEPSGLKTKYTLRNRRVGRSGIPACQVNQVGPIYSYPLRSVIRKTVTGPGLSPLEWNYSYQSIYGHSPFISGKNTTEVQSPDGSRELFEYGNTFQSNEGLLLSTTLLDANGNEKKSTKYTYDFSHGIYGARFGISPRSRIEEVQSGNDARRDFEHLDEHVRPIIKTETTIDRTEFTMKVESFDQLLRPTKIIRTSTPLPTP